MIQVRNLRHHRPLLSQLRWFIRLRWMAGAVVLLGSLAQGKWLSWWYPNAGIMALVGAGILFYNLILWLLMERLFPARSAAKVSPDTHALPLLILAWAQLLLDLACLTLLTLLTGAMDSPLLGFFVFHMVFASLLLPRQLAYAGASVAMGMLAGGLWGTGRFPAPRRENIAMLGWALTLVLTVWLANRITRGLRRQRHQLIRQNRRIRAMSRRLRRQQQGMIQQEKMAVAGRMAAGVAHEIANPLAGMDGLLQLMQRRPDKSRPEAIATLREQVARINQIVRRMTEFAHPGSGTWQTVALNDLVEKTLEVVQFDPRIEGVHVEKHLATEMPPIRVFGDAVQQVILNLAINALDAMEKVVEPKLTISTNCNEQWCSFVIEDNGHGIAAKARDRLFEPFYTTKPVGKGTGLGLSISYSLIRELGGDIIVESRENLGTRFTVRFPIAAEFASHSRETSSAGIATSEKSGQVQSK